jgi:hypothetical protein
MPLRVEFYGMARQWSGASEVGVELSASEVTLHSALGCIARAVPRFSELCLVEGRLHPSLAANLDGQRFVADPATLIRDGQSLLILSADAGG